MNLPVLLCLALQRRGAEAVVAGLFGTILLIALALYVFVALCLMKIAEKTNTPNAWWAWIPILNLLLMLGIARKPLWWILLMLIPVVNIVIAIIVWVAICEARNKSPLLVIGLFIPVANLVVLYILAFTD